MQWAIYCAIAMPIELNNVPSTITTIIQHHMTEPGFGFKVPDAQEGVVLII